MGLKAKSANGTEAAKSKNGNEDTNQSGRVSKSDLNRSLAGQKLLLEFSLIVPVLMGSPVHRHHFLGDIEAKVLPPLTLGQYRLFRDKQQILGVGFWASGAVDSTAAAQA